MRALRFRVMRTTWSAVLTVACAIGAHAQTATQKKWQAGDVFVGIGNGQWEVFRPSLGPSQTPELLSDSDGNPLFTTGAGATNAAGLDNTWHVLTTDSGGSSGSQLIRFRISPEDPGNPSPLTDVLTAFNTACGGAVDPVAITVDGSGNVYIANASPATVTKFDPTTGTCGMSVAIPSNLIGTALAGIDLSSDGSTLYFTSGNNAVGKITGIQTSSWTVSLAASLPSGTKLFDIRTIPSDWVSAAACGTGCPAGDKWLIAAKSNVLLTDTAGNIRHQYQISGQNKLQTLALDPIVRNSGGAAIPLQTFWAGSPASTLFYQMNLNTGAISASFNAGTGIAGVSGIVVYGGFTAAQPTPTFLGTQTLLAQGTTTSTASFVFQQTDSLKMTGYNGVPFTSNFNVSVYAAAVPPVSGTSDTGLPCTQTLAGPTCTIWQADLDHLLPGTALMALALASSQGIDGNTRLLRDERDDISTAFRNEDPTGHSTLSVYSLNQVTGLDGQCTYSPPISEGAVLNNPGNITFKFTCANPNIDVTTLRPRISIVQLIAGAAPVPYFPSVGDITGGNLTGGTCCTTANYRIGNNQWTINVSFKNAFGTFVATTYDDSGTISAFAAQFTVTK